MDERAPSKRIRVVSWGSALLCAAVLWPIAPARAETIYVTNEKSNTVSVIDGKTMDVVKTVPVGQRPRGLVMSRDDKTLFLCASDSNEIEALDLDSYRLSSVAGTPDPERVDISPDGKLLFASNENDNMVSIIDIAGHDVIDQVPVGVEPEGMGVSPDGKFVVNTSETTNMAHFIDIAQHKVVANVLVGSRPRVAVWTHDGAQVWVSSEIGGTVSVIDAAARKVVKTISFSVPGLEQDAVQPEGIAITPDRRLAFVALGPANRVAVVDAQTYAVRDYILVGQRVWGITLNPANTRLYAAGGLSNDLTEIDVPSLEAVKTVTVGEEPWGSAVRP